MFTPYRGTLPQQIYAPTIETKHNKQNIFRDIAGDCPFKAVPTKKTSISRVAIAAVPVRSGRSYSTSEFSKRINTI
eukprot:1395380-Amorphochlora_amoeboformis.AAC.1